MLPCQVLLELVAVQAPCQTLVTAALWSVANHSEESVAALAALDPQPLLQVGQLYSGYFSVNTRLNICVLSPLAC
jgi:hypothetical protein